MDLSPAQIALLNKVSATAFKTAREDLEPGKHLVDTTVTINLRGCVQVGSDYEQRIVEKAKPWDLLTSALALANAQLIAADLVGISMNMITEAAVGIDPLMVKKSKAAAEKAVAARKEATLTWCRGKVTAKVAV